jgi:hypothetical protein
MAGEIHDPKSKIQNPKLEIQNSNFGNGNTGLEVGIPSSILHPSSPPFGYYPTQWRPWPGRTGPDIPPTR